MTIRTIIIDDSLDWRDILTRLVKLHTVLELVGTYASALEAYPHIVQNKVDFIFAIFFGFCLELLLESSSSFIEL